MPKKPLIPCPCCGQTKVTEYEICDVCDWENDPVQLSRPNFAGGANRLCLNEARRLWLKSSGE